METHEELTQQYSTWGDKLLQHTDVLNSIQNHKQFKPITIQLAPGEMCDSDCPFCSVAARPLKSFLPWSKVIQVLTDFRALGAKSVEITGGGNPMLYKDREANKDINDIINVAADLGYKIGIITNSSNLEKIKKENHEKIQWIRISLIKLDEGRAPEDYQFHGFPYSKLGFSYIIYDGTNGIPDVLSRTKKPYAGTTAESIQKIAKLVELHPGIKFVRIAGNCLIKGNNEVIKNQYKTIIDELDKFHKFFIKDIGEDDGPYDKGCYVGAIRPYIAAHPQGTEVGEHQVYICTSHVLNHRVYDLAYSLGPVSDIPLIWERMNLSYSINGFPYDIKGNKGKGWCNTCKYCYYKFNNKLLHTVAQEMPDKDFP